LSREEAIEELGKQRQSWHTVTQEATLRRLADVTGVSADELYRLNKGRLDGLQLGATLRVGTRLLTAGVDGHEDEEYCHWSFPDDESPDEPSPCMQVLITARPPTFPTGASPMTNRPMSPRT
jgi:LysM repeat protein